MIDNRFVVMKFISRHKLLFVCLIMAWIIGMIFTAMLMNRSGSTKIKVQRTSHPLIHPLQHNRLPPPSSFKMVKAMRYCNPPGDINLGHEGRAPANSTLEFVAIVIRHGDRAPLRPIRNQSIIDCGVDPGNPILQKYLRTLKYLRGSAKHLYPFATFPLHPSEKQCVSAQMTIVGAMQHIQLGYSLKEAYIDRHSLLLKNWTSDHIKLYSTVYSRTFQSAVAFLFGFLPSFDISHIRITPSADVRFCMTDYYCHCPLLENLQTIRDSKTRRLLDSHPAVVHLINRLNPIVKHQPNHPNTTSPMVMFDSLMGYVCHGSHLPCIPGTNECVTFEQVRNLIAYLDWEGRQFVKDYTHRKISSLKMHGFLIHLINRIRKYISGESQKRFILYSGHDVTLEPLITALGFDDGTLPPYASRLSFELYSRDLSGKKQYMLKVVYNGKDVTKYTAFCKKYFKSKLQKAGGFGVCPLETFVKFVQNDFALSSNESTFEKACDVTRATLFAYGASPYVVHSSNH